jgi:hypothetical protein
MKMLFWNALGKPAVRHFITSIDCGANFGANKKGTQTILV